jgi:hypothetical protein
MYEIILGRTKSDLKKFGKKGTVLIGKQYVQMGETSSLSNPIYLDVARAHAMLIVGKRGGGKCILGDSEIILEDGSIEKIKNLSKNKNKILSVNDNYKIKPYSCSKWYRREVNEILKITLKTGKELKLTPEHPLLTVNEWREVNSLKIGDRIATPRTIPVEGKKSISIEKAKIIGYLIAEGHLGNGFVLFTNQDKKIIQDFKKSILSFDKELVFKNHSKDTIRIIQNNKKETIITQRNEKGQIISSISKNNKTSLRKYLETLNLYNTTSHTKFIPKEVFTAPNNEIKELLKVLFSCDGSIYKENKNYYKISYCSVSKKIIAQVSHLLLRFGIIARFREKKSTYKNQNNLFYEIELKGIEVEKFITKIGFIGEKKKKAQKALREIKKIKRNSNVDTIPKEIWERYTPKKSWTEIGKEFGYKSPKALRESKRYSPTREKLFQIGTIDNNTEIQNLANSDLFWDEIVDIEKITGKFEVFDLTCPDYNNFIANDIIVHNSYTMGSIAEGLADMETETAKNLAFVLLDTMGVYWSMKYPNKKEEDLLKKWGLEGKGLGVQIYVPGGFYEQYKKDGVPVDFPFYIQPRELAIEDWMNAFKLQTDDPIGVAIQRTVNKMLEKNINFDIDDIIAQAEQDERLDEKTKLAVINRFENCKTWGLFSKQGTKIKDILTGGKVTVMDLSPYVAMPGGWEIKALSLGLIAKKIFIERMMVRKREELFDIVNKTQVVKKEEVEDDLPMPWLIVDEAHEFLPAGDEQSPSKQALITILREGRQPGVSLILATQQPAKIHTDAITQSDIVLAHRLTASFDLEALDKIFLSYNSKGSKALFNQMPRTKGCAIIMDDKNERLHTMQVKPRISWHGGEDPNAIREIKDEFDLD